MCVVGNARRRARAPMPHVGIPYTRTHSTMRRCLNVMAVYHPREPRALMVASVPQPSGQLQPLIAHR